MKQRQSAQNRTFFSRCTTPSATHGDFDEEKKAFRRVLSTSEQQTRKLWCRTSKITASSTTDQASERNPRVHLHGLCISAVLHGLYSQELPSRRASPACLPVRCCGSFLISTCSVLCRTTCFGSLRPTSRIGETANLEYRVGGAASFLLQRTLGHYVRSFPRCDPRFNFLPQTYTMHS